MHKILFQHFGNTDKNRRRIPKLLQGEGCFWVKLSTARGALARRLVQALAQQVVQQATTAAVAITPAIIVNEDGTSTLERIRSAASAPNAIDKMTTVAAVYRYGSGPRGSLSIYG
jgi:CRISPR/Cas system-associated endoribonuclease Cas2